MDFSSAAWSIFSVCASTGGKSTTRRIEPFGGGGTPMGRSARSCRRSMRAGVSSGTHNRLLTKAAPGRTFTCGQMPSLSTMALPLSSWPVTMRRIWWVGCMVFQEGGSIRRGAGVLDGRPPALVLLAHEPGHLRRGDRVGRFHRRLVQQVGEMRRGLQPADLVGQHVDDAGG